MKLSVVTIGAVLLVCCGGEASTDTTAADAPTTSEEVAPTTETMATTTLPVTTTEGPSELEALTAEDQELASDICSFSEALAAVEVGQSAGQDPERPTLSDVHFLQMQAGFLGPTLGEYGEALAVAHRDWAGQPDLVQTEALKAVTEDITVACETIGWTPAG